MSTSADSETAGHDHPAPATIWRMHSCCLLSLLFLSHGSYTHLHFLPLNRKSKIHSFIYEHTHTHTESFPTLSF
ncbi:hypothetical protein AMELA_G00296060 [Ameiurus melas]|uniref:Uncharacterized protein n=1 Tax=Ameiurus melas TaxID=219545 RepID=A0A7J5ZI94_AMEME|nr:hypothetical protein AMELA_G00296060 [Ameiurus melas]